MMRTILILLGLTLSCEVAIAQMRVERDVVYAKHGDSNRKTSLDVYSPSSGTGQPVMIWIHGGGWTIGDKRAVQEKTKAFVAKRFVFVSVNYRLHPDVNYDEQAGDIAKAIRWVSDHIKEYGGDAKQIGIMGHSAGAHLAALVATDDRYLKAEQLQLSDVKAVILLDGAGYDIPKHMRWPLAKAKRLYTTIFSDDEVLQRKASPITYVAKGKGIPPFLIVHVANRLGSKMQSKAFAKALQQADVAARVFPAQNKTHATINREFGIAADAPTKQAFSFLSEIFGVDRPSP